MTAPRAIPRRPWRSLNAFSARRSASRSTSPGRPPRRSGSRGRGLRDCERARHAASAGWRTRTPPPAARRPPRRPGTAGTRARGLHRARDIAQQHDPAADDLARSRRASRIGLPAVRRLPRSVRRMSIRLAVAAPLRAPGAPPRRRERQLRHQPMQLRELVRCERIKALGAQHLLVAGRQPRPAAPRGIVSGCLCRPRYRGQGTGADVVMRRSDRTRGAPGVGLALGSAAARSGAARQLRCASEYGREHRIERPDLRALGDEHGARGPVQPPPRDRASERQRVARIAPRVRGRPASRVAEPPAEGDRERREDPAGLSQPSSRPSPTSAARPEATTSSWSSRYLSTDPSVRSAARASSCSTPSAVSAASQSIASAIPGASARRSRASARPRRRPGRRATASAPRTRRRTISTSRWRDGYSIHWYRQRRLTASWRSRVRLEVSTTIGGWRGADRSELRDRHRRLRQSSSSRNASNSSSARSISSISSTGGRGPAPFDRAQQRPARPDIALRTDRLLGAARSPVRLGESDREQLARIVPFVERVALVDPLVALQANQPASSTAASALADLGLADPGLALEQQRLGQPQRQEHRGRQALVDEVVDAPEPIARASRRRGRERGPRLRVAAGGSPI